MLDYHYQISAPPETPPGELKESPQGLREYALDLGFQKAVTIDCVFKSVDQPGFARRICRLPTFEDERLSLADFSANPCVFRQDRDCGICRVCSVGGHVLFVENNEGLEPAFGFLRFPEKNTGVGKDDAPQTIEHPVGEHWSFSGGVQSGAPGYQRRVHKIAERGFLEWVKDEYPPNEVDQRAEAENNLNQPEDIKFPAGINPQGHKVIILKGRFAGQEGICLGPSQEDKRAVSPDNSNEIVNLVFEEEFGILLNPGQEPGSN